VGHADVSAATAGHGLGYTETRLVVDDVLSTLSVYQLVTGTLLCPWNRAQLLHAGDADSVPAVIPKGALIIITTLHEVGNIDESCFSILKDLTQLAGAIGRRIPLLYALVVSPLEKAPSFLLNHLCECRRDSRNYRASGFEPLTFGVERSPWLLLGPLALVDFPKPADVIVSAGVPIITLGQGCEVHAAIGQTCPAPCLVLVTNIEAAIDAVGVGWEASVDRLALGQHAFAEHANAFGYVWLAEACVTDSNRRAGIATRAVGAIDGRSNTFPPSVALIGSCAGVPIALSVPAWNSGGCPSVLTCVGLKVTDVRGTGVPIVTGFGTFEHRALTLVLADDRRTLKFLRVLGLFARATSGRFQLPTTVNGVSRRVQERYVYQILLPIEQS